MLDNSPVCLRVALNFTNFMDRGAIFVNLRVAGS
jgi:hypothetical protein